MHKKNLKYLLLFLMAALVSCSSYGEVVKKRAAFDLNCPSEQVDVDLIGGTSYGAKGCNKRATYNCTHRGNYAVEDAITCVKEESKKD